MTDITTDDIAELVELVEGIEENVENEFNEVPASVMEMIGATQGYLRCLRTRIRRGEDREGYVGGALFKEERKEK